MIFHIYRTNNFVFSENSPPCNKAFIKEFERPGWGNKYKIVQSKGREDNNIGVEYSIEIYDDYRE